LEEKEEEERKKIEEMEAKKNKGWKSLFTKKPKKDKKK